MPGVPRGGGGRGAGAAKRRAEKGERGGGSKKRKLSERLRDNLAQCEYDAMRIMQHLHPRGTTETDLLETMIVGHPFEVFYSTGSKAGRVISYDAEKRLHLVALDGFLENRWMALKDEPARICLEVVWARVEGCAWWPCRLFCHTAKFEATAPYDLKPERLLVVFFNGETHGWVDPGLCGCALRLLTEDCEREMLKKAVGHKAHVRPKVEAALKEAKAEQRRVCGMQEQAMADAAQRKTKKQTVEKGQNRTAAGMKNTLDAPSRSNKQSPGGNGGKGPKVKKPTLPGDWVELLIKVFSNKINYPVGGWLTGVVKQYSVLTKEHLVLYDDKKRMPEWVSIGRTVVEPIDEDTRRELLESQKPKNLSMTRGHDFLLFQDDDAVKGEEPGPVTCRNCETNRGQADQMVTCCLCGDHYHGTCVDAPWCKPASGMAARREWVCPACVCCDGCTQRTKELRQDDRLEEVRVDGRRALACPQCAAKYQGKEYCPTCRKTWGVEGSSDIDQRMLKCDWPGCSLWVHAACERLSVEEYELITREKHPLSKEYFCPLCRKEALKWVLDVLNIEDSLQLFAQPVTEDIAPKYFETVKRPMDITTMQAKLDRGEYRNTQAMRDDMELMVKNAVLFNSPQTRYWREALRFMKAVQERLQRATDRTSMSTHGKEALALSQTKKNQRQPQKRPQDDGHSSQGRSRSGASHQSEALSDDEKSLAVSVSASGRPQRSAAAQVADYGYGRTQAAPARSQQQSTQPRSPVKSRVEKARPPLKLTLQKPKEPESFSGITEVNMTDFDAYYLAWLETCLACGASGDPSKLLFCMDCGEAYHAQCVEVPMNNIGQYARATWRCVNCKMCESCGDPQPNEAANLLQCELCDRGHHMKCCDPPLETAPADPWYCGTCVNCKLCGRKTEARNWSCHPDVCHQCGGHSELNAELRMRCHVCLEVWVDEGVSHMATCDKCAFWVHASCDSGAASKLAFEAAGRDDQRRPVFICKTCISEEIDLMTMCQEQERQKQFEESRPEGHQASDSPSMNGMAPPPVCAPPELLGLPSQPLGEPALLDDVVKVEEMGGGPGCHAQGPFFAAASSHMNGHVTKDGLTAGSPNGPRASFTDQTAFEPKPPLYCPTPAPAPLPDVPEPVQTFSHQTSSGFGSSASHVGTYAGNGGGGGPRSSAGQAASAASAPSPSMAGALGFLGDPFGVTAPFLGLGLPSALAFAGRGPAVQLPPPPPSQQQVQPSLDLAHAYIPPSPGDSFMNLLLPGPYGPNTALTSQIMHGQLRLPPAPAPPPSSRTPRSHPSYAGVQRNPYSGKPWQAVVQADDRGIKVLGRFDTQAEAAWVFDLHVKNSGNAPLNFKTAADRDAAVAYERANSGQVWPGAPLQSPTSSYPQGARKGPVPATVASASQFFPVVAPTPSAPRPQVPYQSLAPPTAPLVQPPSFPSPFAPPLPLPPPPASLPPPSPPPSPPRQPSGDQSPRRGPRPAVPASHSIVTYQLELKVIEKRTVEHLQRVRWALKLSQPRPEVIRPLKGWVGAVPEAAAQKLGEWEDPRKCVLCRAAGEDEFTGRFLPMEDGLWVHSNCGFWSAEAFEHDCVIHNVCTARRRSAMLKCRGCEVNGATVGCCAKGCKENFHFLCALSKDCYFLTDKRVYCRGHDQLTMMGDVGHFQELSAVDLLEREHLVKVAPPEQGAKPGCPKGFKGATLGQGIALKAGALTVHTLGQVVMDSPYFHSPEHIFPLGYRATRIFWSASRPHHRSLWVCQIMSREEEGPDPVLAAVNYSDQGTQLMEQESLPTVMIKRPWFRLLCLDEPDMPYEGTTLDGVYTQVMQAVARCQAPAIASLQPGTVPPCRKRAVRPSTATYGLTAHHFVGLSLPTVRKAIEELSGVAMMAVLATYRAQQHRDTPMYRFCHTLPDQDALAAAQRALELRRASMVKTDPHCARVTEASQVIHSVRGKSMKRSRVRVAEVLDADDDASHSGATHGGRQAGSSTAESNRGATSMDNRKMVSLEQRYRDLKSEPMGTKLEVKRSRIHGWGLFAKEPVEDDGMVAEYIGEVIRPCVADLREKQYEESGMGSCYLFRLDRHEIVDATMKGNMGRFVNHSCDSNCYARVITIDNGEKKIVLFAKRSITCGEELTYDYRFPIEDEKIPCFCGAAKCQRYMN